MKRAHAPYFATASSMNRSILAVRMVAARASEETAKKEHAEDRSAITDRLVRPTLRRKSLARTPLL
eukprot:3652050-Alexandrium_andersonii.AAC.1